MKKPFNTELLEKIKSAGDWDPTIYKMSPEIHFIDANTNVVFAIAQNYITADMDDNAINLFANKLGWWYDKEGNKLYILDNFNYLLIEFRNKIKMKQKIQIIGQLQSGSYAQYLMNAKLFGHKYKFTHNGMRGLWIKCGRKWSLMRGI